MSHDTMTRDTMSHDITKPCNRNEAKWLTGMGLKHNVEIESDVWSLSLSLVLSLQTEF